jgi:hypothetical protein
VNDQEHPKKGTAVSKKYQTQPCGHQDGTGELAVPERVLVL